MITNDYKNGYNYDTRGSKGCATSKREISRFEMFLFDTFIGLIGGMLLALPVAIWAITTY